MKKYIDKFFALLGYCPIERPRMSGEVIESTAIKMEEIKQRVEFTPTFDGMVDRQIYAMSKVMAQSFHKELFQFIEFEHEEADNGNIILRGKLIVGEIKKNR